MDERLHFTIKPRRRRPAFMLESGALTFPTWYLKLENAIYQATRCRDRAQAVIVEIFDHAGVVVRRIDYTADLLLDASKNETALRR